MLKLPKEVKREIFNLLKVQPNVFGTPDDRNGIIPFIESIWDIRAMPSTDVRFKDGYGDIYQHTINNNDWTDEYLFLDILHLLDNDDKFNLFLETIVNPTNRKDEDEIIKFALLINPYLKRYGHTLAVNQYTETGLPAYKIVEWKEGDESFADLKPNNISFFTELSPSGRSNSSAWHEPPKSFPSFMLVFNKGWNDYSVWSSFNLFFYSSDKTSYNIGSVKIISNGDEQNTSEVIPKNFTELNDNFCSLGQDIDYYQQLKELLGRNLESVLYALKDAAFFPDIHDRFSRNFKFLRSLIRYDGAERLLRVAKYQVYDYDLANLYKFKYVFQPLYANEPVNIEFEFDNQVGFHNRIYALIGKNGTGKTQLITLLPNNIARKQKDFFFPSIPSFSKVIAVSYSIFDRFEIPKKTSSFNYVYCGLRNDKNEEISEKGLMLRFHHSWKRIEEFERIEQWRRILINFIDKDIVESFIVSEEIHESKESKFKVSIDGFHDIKTKLSSGQSIILYIITEIVANIRYDSLLLYDEPETHLHPNAITELINTIYELVNEFESYCIIATHSPIIIRELFSKNVYVIERHDNTPAVRRIGIESFGESISVLTDEVFGNKDMQKQYKKIIDELTAEGKTFEQVVELLEFDQIPLSLNTRLYIKSAIKDRDAQS